jgi:hypothetical protein
VILVIGGLIGSSKTTLSAVTPGTRALIVPTGDAARTVVIPPCGTGASAATATAGTTTAGTVSFLLPKGFGTRIVLIPMCSTAKGGSAAINGLPSAAFVTKPGTGIPPIGPANSLASSASSSQVGAPNTAQFQVTVPNGSPIRTVIIAPCQHTSGPTETLLGTTSNSTTAVAPSC